MSFGGSGGGFQPTPSALPDYKSLWSTYAGWMENINKRNEGEVASVRARLSAQGARPDLIKMQTEHLESQRVGELEELKSTSTYGALQEGFDIAVGKKVSPYSSVPAGFADFRATTKTTTTPGTPAQSGGNLGADTDTTNPFDSQGMLKSGWQMQQNYGGMGEGDERPVFVGENPDVATTPAVPPTTKTEVVPAKRAAPGSMDEYFNEFYGFSGAQGATPEEQKAYADERARSAAQGRSASTATTGGASSEPNPWLSDDRVSLFSQA